MERKGTLHYISYLITFLRMNFSIFRFGTPTLELTYEGYINKKRLGLI